MRTILIVLVTGVLAVAQSHPSWWTLASPEATALVGIHWDTLKHSVLAEPVSAELASTGSLGFPDLPCLKNASQILISAPSVLAIASGPFSASTVRAEAVAARMTPATYKNIGLWISPGRTLSVAQLSDQLLLIGLRKTLENAIDRSEEARSEETRSAEKNDRQYSPLLARAARYSTKDLWVVAASLPDPLASLFVPIEHETKNFDGSVSVQEGLHLEAVVDAGSQDAAAAIGETLRGSIEALPSVARDLKIEVDAQRVVLTLGVSQEQLVSGLRQPPAPAEPLPVASQRSEPPQPPTPEAPMIIRIFGLDDGPREIALPPAKLHQF